MSDDIKMEILEDGTVSITTTSISQANHISADELMEEITKAIGGEVVKKKNKTGYFDNKQVLRGGKIITIGGK